MVTATTLRAGTAAEADLNEAGLNAARVVIKRAIGEGAFPGAVFLVARNGIVAMHEALGYASAVSERRPMRTNTIFDLASITKPIASLAAMLLVESGCLRLDDPVGEFIPEFRSGDKLAITVRRLLSHTSGIPGQIPLYQHARDRAEILRQVYRLDLLFTPGTGVVYSSQGFMLLDEVMSKVVSYCGVAGSWNELLEVAVFRPLGLNSTRFLPPDEWRENAAATENCAWRGRIVVGEVHDRNAFVMGGIAAHAGLFSTAWDLAVIGQMMLNRGCYGASKILAPRTVEVMTSCHTHGLPLARGLGWQMKDVSGSPAGDLMSDRSFGHTGFTGTCIWMDPATRLLGVLLTNRIHPTRENEKITRVRPLFYNAITAACE